VFALAREAGESIKPGVKRSETPGCKHILMFKPMKWATVRANTHSSIHLLFPNSAAQGRCRPLRGLDLLPLWSWGSAALHPRLYAVTRYRGFEQIDYLLDQIMN
jgi:hypothetical protein